MHLSIDCGESGDSCIKLAAICTIILGRVEAAQSNESIIDINNHADTTVLGSNCLPIHNFEILVDVSGRNTSVVGVEFPTIYGATEYDHQISGQVYMLVYHQAMNFTRLEKT